VTTAAWLRHAGQYADLGWKVFPLHGIKADGQCTCGDGDCRSIGKHPLTLHGVKDASSDPVVLQAWATQYPNSNLGLALLDGLVAVDTDPRNGGDSTLDALFEEHGAFPETVLAMTGGGGTHHLFFNRSGRKLPGKLGKGIDLKGDGGYIVVEPSRHASGNSYSWEASCDPLDGMLVADLPDWIGTTQATGSAPLTLVAGTGFISPGQRLELRSALAFCDPNDRDTWLINGMALHSTGAAEAFAIWTEWSQLSEKYDPADQRRVWASFSNGKHKKVHLATIFAKAAESGWVNPASQVAARFDEATTAAIEAANRRTVIELVPDAPKPAARAPIPVTTLQAMAEWMDSSYPVTHPDATRHAVLALAALAASRVYVGEGGTPCHLCLGLVAESTVMTSYVRDAIARVIDEAGLRRMMRGTRANVPSNVYSTLWRSPAAIHVINDYGHLAQFAKRQPSGVLDQAFSAMADAYTSGSIYIDSGTEAGLKPSASDDQLVIHSPALTTVLLSTQSQMGALLQRGELTRGLLAHQLSVILDTADVTEREVTSSQSPAWIREAMRQVRRLPAVGHELSIAEIFGAQPGARPNLIKVRFARDFTEYQNAINSVSGEPGHRPLLIAAQQTARRLATTLGAWANPAQPMASQDILIWATEYVTTHLRAWLENYSTLGNDGEVDDGQKVVAAIASRRSEGIARGKLHNICWAFRKIRDKDKRNSLIDSLIEDEYIVEIVPPGKSAKVLVLARYARQVELKVVK